MADGLKADGGKAAKLLFLTTADTEILAAAKARDSLPEGFPELRCANPANLDDPPSELPGMMEDTRAVVVRLLGGRKAWPEGFDALGALCRERGIP
ncbi:MAG: hypothetical protein ACRDSJ_14145, partial [Rubrobacteraceae bacterium]